MQYIAVLYALLCLAGTKEYRQKSAIFRIEITATTRQRDRLLRAFTQELTPSVCMTMSAARVAPQDKVLMVLFL